MFTQLVYNNANFNIYTIDENCNIKKNSILLSNDDIIYHSTNGYDYVKLEQFSGQSILYPLDQVMWSSFNPKTRSIFQQFRCIHLNGELRDNRPENLKAVNDIEEWRIVTYPDVRANIYCVSSHGRIFNNHARRFLSPKKDVKSDKPGDFYLIYHMASYNNVKDVMAHRLVAYEFINNDIAGYVINHINGCKNDNNVLNLEICTQKKNAVHAHMVDLYPIGEEMHNTVLTSTDVNIICRVIKDTRGNIPKSIQLLRDMEFDKCDNEHIQDWIYSIKTGRIWRHVSKNYFDPDDLLWKKPTKFLTESDINLISECLVKCDGSPKEALELIRSLGYSYISMQDVGNIRYKTHHAKLSDKWFILDETRKFVPIE